ncbi:hypothetical protein SERLA73DRAFT_160229 [Serpula lacrymans var. lacrymans S7.3]|uniref:Kinesin light chain n=1 Tax=Serpula lacrymans var. lacrymans (strain S7.3) TaxID=936435 RepID=F8PWI3_SERL3|nr:hypothetical protein SERLA73DRAFT_160229 [Serpula lacrymans var. lacrymans S7.3]
MVLIKSTLIEHLSAMICSIGLSRVIRQLQELSLVYCTGSVDATVLHMHDLTSFLVREMTRVDGFWEDFFDCTVDFIGVAIDNISDTGSPKCWPQCALIASHVQSLANIENIQGANQKLLGGRFFMAEYMHIQGRYKDTETVYIEILKIKQEQLGFEHPNTLLTVNNLAAVYDSQGKYIEAEALYGRALAGQEKQLGAEHTGDSEQPGISVFITGKLQVSHTAELVTRAASSDIISHCLINCIVVTLGAEHPHTLRIVNNLAAVYSSQGKYTEAEALYGRALAGQEK